MGPIFNVTFKNAKLDEATKSVFDSVRSGAESGHNKGMVLAQVFELAGGKVRIKGMFLGAEKSAKVQAILFGTDG